MNSQVGLEQNPGCWDRFAFDFLYILYIYIFDICYILYIWNISPIIFYYIFARAGTNFLSSIMGHWALNKLAKLQEHAFTSGYTLHVFTTSKIYWKYHESYDHGCSSLMLLSLLYLLAHLHFQFYNFQLMAKFCKCQQSLNTCKILQHTLQPSKCFLQDEKSFNTSCSHQNVFRKMKNPSTHLAAIKMFMFSTFSLPGCWMIKGNWNVPRNNDHSCKKNVLHKTPKYCFCRQAKLFFLSSIANPGILLLGSAVENNVFAIEVKQQMLGE